MEIIELIRSMKYIHKDQIKNLKEELEHDAIIQNSESSDEPVMIPEINSIELEVLDTVPIAMDTIPDALEFSEAVSMQFQFRHSYVPAR